MTFSFILRPMGKLKLKKKHACVNTVGKHSVIVNSSNTKDTTLEKTLYI